MNIPVISLKPATLFMIGPVAVNGNMLGAFLTSLILIALALFLKRSLSLVPGRTQMVMEMLLGFFLAQLTSALGSPRRARLILPLIMTVFLFLCVANQLLLLPIIGSLTLGENYLFLTPTAHYSLTIALSVLILGGVNLIAFTASPFRYFGNFFKFSAFLKIKSWKELPMAGVDFFLGLMDIIGELAKFISTSTRLFGNLFAGGVVIAIISGLLFITQFIFPIPFIVLGILSGLVQAFVFSMLMLLFVSQSLNAVRRPSASNQ